MEPDAIGKRLKVFREGRGLTLRALAAQAGVPQSTLSQVESGSRPGAGLRIGTVQRLCWALGVGIGEFAGALDTTPNDLMGFDNERMPRNTNAR